MLTDVELEFESVVFVDDVVLEDELLFVVVEVSLDFSLELLEFV